MHRVFLMDSDIWVTGIKVWSVYKLCKKKHNTTTQDTSPVHLVWLCHRWTKCIDGRSHWALQAAKSFYWCNVSTNTSSVRRVKVWKRSSNKNFWKLPLLLARFCPEHYPTFWFTYSMHYNHILRIITYYGASRSTKIHYTTSLCIVGDG